MTDWNYEQDGLTIQATRTGARATVRWSGISDSRVPGAFLNPVVRELVANLKTADVTIDFTKLEYMNSATVAPMISLVRLLDENGNAVVVVFSDNDWQRTHMKCMMAIARTLRQVRVEGRPNKDA